MDLARHRRDWEELAADDPLWAVLTAPGKRGGRWSRAEFLATGAREVAEVLGRCAQLGRPARRRRALDFGCGAGRLTRALGGHFDEAVGVDIAEGMLGVARELNADRPQCTFVHNAAPDLHRFEDGSFDLVYSSLVLQHLPSRALVESYVREFVRVVGASGIVVFQLPASLSLPHRLQASRRAYGLARRIGVRERFLLRRTPLTPMGMLAVPPDRVRAVVAEAGGSVLAADPLDAGRSRRYFAVAGG